MFPESFEVRLNPGKEYYYIANNYLRIHFQNDGGDLKGQMYEYGFEGWDGTNPSSCSFMYEVPLDKSDHSTT